MWLATTTGFYSATFKNNQMQIRARDKADLEALREKFAPELGPVIETFGADYPYRALCSPEEWGRICARIGSNVRYDNFKNEVAAVQGKNRASIYSRVWSALLDIETAETATARRKWHPNSVYTSSFGSIDEGTVGGAEFSETPSIYSYKASELIAGDLTNFGEVLHVESLGKKNMIRVHFIDGSTKKFGSSKKIDVMY
jgi:hypothetical protein